MCTWAPGQVADGQEDARSVFPEQKISTHVGNGPWAMGSSLPDRQGE